MRRWGVKYQKEWVDRQIDVGRICHAASDRLVGSHRYEMVNVEC